MNCPLCQKSMDDLKSIQAYFCLKCDLSYETYMSETDYQAMSDFYHISEKRLTKMKQEGHFYFQKQFYTVSEMDHLQKMKAFL